MNRFLLYFSPSFIEDTKAMNAALDALNEIGKASPADFNVYTVETDQKAPDVQTVIRNVKPNGAAYFVATVNKIGYAGDGQFSSTLRKFE